MDMLIKFLASPVRVLHAISKILVATLLIAPLLILGKAGFLLWVTPGIPMWMMMTLTVYGWKDMTSEKTSWRLWFWRHLEVWWIDPDSTCPR